MLNAYRHHFGEEATVVDQVEQLVTSHSDCFERTCRPGHVTGSAWVMSEDRQRCVLVRHAKLDRWIQPGGHADGDNDIAAVALREVREETGLTRLNLVREGDIVIPLDIDIHQIPARTDSQGRELESTHEHHDIRFLVIADRNEPLVRSEESLAVGWFDRQGVLQLTDEPSVLRMLHKAGPHTGQL